MSSYPKGQQIIGYIAPHVSLFPTKFALLFGTRRGIPKFIDDTLSFYNQGCFSHVILSGGFTCHLQDSEASVLYKALRARGMPENALIVEDEAMNTGENVRFSRKRVYGLGVEDLFLIGKISSKRRYIMTVRKQWPEVRKICCHGVNYFSSAADRWWKDREFRTRVFCECRKIPRYIERGFLADVQIVNGVVL